DRDPALPLLGRFVDLVVRQELREPLLRQHLRDRGRQRRLPVVDVPDRPDVQVWLVPNEFLFCHPTRPILWFAFASSCPAARPISIRVEPTTRIERVTSSLPRTCSAN